jgi:beta-mannosidase
MFANLDYPTEDPAFAAEIEREARSVLTELAGRPSLAVVCGNSEVEQQPAMMGLDPTLGRAGFWEQTVPGLVKESGADCAYLRSTPSGGALPFHPEGGATHYFGVSGYFMPLSDLRRDQVRFASECLAFANVPDDVEVPVHHPRWKEGVPRDAGTGWGIGAGWDFDDVRDHYLESLYGVDAVQLRRSDHERYLELSRAASGEIMAAAMGEWRRARSACQGALVLWLKDMLPGAGLGVIDHRGRPKVVYHHLRRALAPVAVWMTDEGLAGVTVHVANDRDQPLRAGLRIALYRDGETLIDEAAEEIELDPHAELLRTVESMLGRFVDVAWAYRFGPPIADAIVAVVEPLDGNELSVAPCFHFPVQRPIAREPLPRLGIQASVSSTADAAALLTVGARRLTHGVRLQIPGLVPEDDCFSLEPGRQRSIRLRPVAGPVAAAHGSLTALNLDGRCAISAATA